MLPPGALENADNPDLATGQKIITTSCSFILNKLNFVGRGVQRTQNFQDLAHGLIEKTAFTTISGHFEFMRMLFGLCNAAPHCQQLMDFLSAGLQWEICLCYLDDIIYSRTFTDHLSNLRTVFERLRAAGLKVLLTKFTFCRSEVPYLGHIISKDGIKADPSKIAVVRDYPVPTTVKEVRQFIGFTSYYRKFIKNFVSIAAPLHKLTNKYARFVWSQQCQEAFDLLWESLISAPILCHPDFSLPFIVYTDASDVGIGAVLAQKDKQSLERTNCFASCVLSKSERGYAPVQCEALAIVYAVKEFRPYLYGNEFTVIMDDNPLRWLQSVKDSSDCLLRWSLKLQEYNSHIEHRPDTHHTNADTMSRSPYRSEVQQKSISLRSPILHLTSFMSNNFVILFYSQSLVT